MSKFTTEELSELGFQINVVPKEENDGVSSYFYYTYVFDGLCLISGAFEKDVKEVTVEFFEGKKPLSKKLVKTIIQEYGSN